MHHYVKLLLLLSYFCLAFPLRNKTGWLIGKVKAINSGNASSSSEEEDYVMHHPPPPHLLNIGTLDIIEVSTKLPNRANYPIVLEPRKIGRIEFVQVDDVASCCKLQFSFWNRIQFKNTDFCRSFVPIFLTFLRSCDCLQSAEFSVEPAAIH